MMGGGSSALRSLLVPLHQRPPGHLQRPLPRAVASDEAAGVYEDAAGDAGKLGKRLIPDASPGLGEREAVEAAGRGKRRVKTCPRGDAAACVGGGDAARGRVSPALEGVRPRRDALHPPLPTAVGEKHQLEGIGQRQLLLQAEDVLLPRAAALRELQHHPTRIHLGRGGDTLGTRGSCPRSPRAAQCLSFPPNPCASAAGCSAEAARGALGVHECVGEYRGAQGGVGEHGKVCDHAR